MFIILLYLYLYSHRPYCFPNVFIHFTYSFISDKMASEATLSIDGSKSYRNGTQRSNDALEKFEKSFSRINTPIWMREKVPKIRLPATTTDEDLNYNENTFDDTKNSPSEIDNDDSYIESRENLSIISRDSDSTTIQLIQNATQNVDKSSSTGRIRYSDYRRACAALAAAVKSRNATLSSNSGSSRARSVPHSYDKWLSNRIRHHTDVHKLSTNCPPMPDGYVYDQQPPDTFPIQRRYGYGRSISRDTSPAPPDFPPPPPPLPQAMMGAASDAHLPESNCLPGSSDVVGRWSTSTLCDSAYSGNNTPTDSVISECKSHVSTRSYLHSSNNTMRQKSYLGWRSQDNLLDSKTSAFSNDPTQRLAYTYKQGILSGRASVTGVSTDRSRLSTQDFGGIRSQSYSRSLPRNCFGSQLSHLKPNQLNPQDSQTDLHESIKSVSSAIMEFCKADDVPLPPPDEKIRQMRTRTKDQHQKSRVVWMESSFVSAKKDSPPNEKIQIQITPSATNGSICNDVT